MAGGTEITMSITEYRLLCLFVTHSERAYTRAQILDAVWVVMFILMSVR